MKKLPINIIVGFAIIANFTGCALRVYENGHLLLSDSSNSNGHLHVHSRLGTDIDFQGSRDNSTPTGIAMYHSRRMLDDVVTGAAVFAPIGTATTSANLIKGAAVVAPQVQSNSPSVK